MTWAQKCPVKSNIYRNTIIVPENLTEDIVQKPDISAAIQAVMAPVRGETRFPDPAITGRRSDDILGTSNGSPGQINDLLRSSGQDILKDINKFITAVLRLAGFDFGDRSRDLDYRDQDARLVNYFDSVDAGDVQPGDLISFMSSGKQNFGLIESFDPETRTGKMYGSDSSDENIKSIDIRGQDLENEASIMRPLMQFFIGNAAGIDAMEDINDADYYEEMNNSYYPSPSPY